MRGVWGLGFVVVMGCSSAESTSDRPAPSGGNGGESSVAAPRNDDAPVCVPGSTRDCNQHFVGADGYKYCPPSFELCRPDGFGWYECGAWQRVDGGFAPARATGGASR
jgi:hypothetical protein